MKTFIIFDRKTGNVLQMHVQPDDVYTGPEELLKRVRPEASIDTVDVIEAEEGFTPGTSFRVDVKARKLIPLEPSKARAASAAFVQSVPGDPRMARTAIVQVPKKNQ